MESKTKKIKIISDNGKFVQVSQRFFNGVKIQMTRTIKQKRIEDSENAHLYFYGIASFVYDKAEKEYNLVIEYGDALSALELDVKNKIYVDIQFRKKPSKKQTNYFTK